MSDMERERALKRLNPFPGQLVCFSSLMYDSLEALDRKRPLPVIGEETRVLLLTGIARPGPLLARVREITPHVTHLKYPDHHSFTVKNIAKIAEIFKGIGGSERIILTTEKDAARLRANTLKRSEERRVGKEDGSKCR